MQQIEHKVSLGFINQKVQVGTHMCLIYNTEEERLDSLLKFLLSGLQSGERSICFSEGMDEDTLRDYLQKQNISFDENKQSDAISLSGVRDVYFKDGVFNPERMLENLEKFHDDSKTMNFKAARVIGEMLPEVEQIKGGDRLLEYESLVSILLRDHPITTICQYNANHFNGATIMDILKVHPQMIVNGAVLRNPMYIHPEEYLGMNQG